MNPISGELRMIAEILDAFPRLEYTIKKIKSLEMSASKFDSLEDFLKELRYELYGDEMGGQ